MLSELMSPIVSEIPEIREAMEVLVDVKNKIAGEGDFSSFQINHELTSQLNDAIFRHRASQEHWRCLLEDRERELARSKSKLRQLEEKQITQASALERLRSLAAVQQAVINRLLARIPGTVSRVKEAAGSIADSLESSLEATLPRSPADTLKLKAGKILVEQLYTEARELESCLSVINGTNSGTNKN